LDYDPARSGIYSLGKLLSERLSCVLADDHPAILAALGDALAGAGLDVVARVGTGTDAIREIEARKPSLAIVDLRLPDSSGTEVARKVARSTPQTAVVLYTAHGERKHLLEAVDAGVRGFVLKEAPLGDLLRAVEIVGRGGTYVDPILGGVLASGDAADKVPGLTTREREILRLLADGLTNDEIGKRLFISGETVRTHIRKAMGKLEADTRTQAVAEAMRRSLIA
jgi:DNA-binding NarL/FixJ family response regulator